MEDIFMYEENNVFVNVYVYVSTWHKFDHLTLSKYYDLWNDKNECSFFITCNV
jgi:hypothetical protein